MAELAEIKAKTSPENIFLVVDAMIGQDAVKTSAHLHDRLAVSGIISASSTAARAAVGGLDQG